MRRGGSHIAESLATGSPVATAERGCALIVALESGNAQPGGYWAIWRVTPADLEGDRVVPATATRAGLHPRLLAALGPNTIFSRGLWVDREGWVWSPLFSDPPAYWTRRRDNCIGRTPLSSRAVFSNSFMQGTQGSIWCVTGKMRDRPMVWVDVSPTGDEPAHYARESWVGAQLRGMGPGAQLAIAPDNRVYLLHEGGCSLLEVWKLTDEEKAKLATRPATTRNSGPGVQASVSGDWKIHEVARREWPSPRNQFGKVSFDANGIWFLPDGGPLVRVPLPKQAQ